MIRTDQGGSRASRLGKATESDVENQLKHFGLREATAKEKAKFRLGTVENNDIGDAWYAKNIKKFNNIYGVQFFADFYVYHKDKLPNGLIIEVKSQDSPGSVDEKYVFTVLSLIGVRDVDSWIVFEGAGARACAIDWMRRQSDKNTNRFTFMTYAQFRRKIMDVMQ